MTIHLEGKSMRQAGEHCQSCTSYPNLYELFQRKRTNKKEALNNSNWSRLLCHSIMLCHSFVMPLNCTPIKFNQLTRCLLTFLTIFLSNRERPLRVAEICICVCVNLCFLQSLVTCIYSNYLSLQLVSNMKFI